VAGGKSIGEQANGEQANPAPNFSLEQRLVKTELSPKTLKLN
jgi:hypothetical protein